MPPTGTVEMRPPPAARAGSARSAAVATGRSGHPAVPALPLSSIAAAAAAVASAEPDDVFHECAMCDRFPLSRARYECQVCDDFSLCEECHAGAAEARDNGLVDPGTHAASHAMKRCVVSSSLEPLHAGPLSAVAANAARRWFADALRGAQQSDGLQMALVGNMYAEGYGCTRDATKAAFWAAAARRAGREADGVYDERP